MGHDVRASKQTISAKGMIFSTRGCKDERATVKLPDKAKDDTTVTFKTYGGGKDGAEVVMVIIQGMGHTWPGRQPALTFLGKATRDVSVNEMMWKFVKKHLMR